MLHQEVTEFQEEKPLIGMDGDTIDIVEENVNPDEQLEFDFKPLLDETNDDTQYLNELGPSLIDSLKEVQANSIESLRII